MLEKISKFVPVISIIAIILTLVFSYLSIKGEISPEQFMTVFTVVIAFYFSSTQNGK